MTPIADPSSPDASSLGPKRETYAQLLLRLSDLSVRKCYDPYLSIDWNAPEHRIDPGDPRLCIEPSHPLARTAWYQGLDDLTRSRFGMEWSAQQLKYGIGFEAVLSRGLFEFCRTQANDSPAYRYAMHEIVEESRHSLMFHEVIRRTGCDPQPIGYIKERIDDVIARWGRTAPELFFFAVLAGELFIDEHNRSILKRPASEVHPLIRLIMQIHVTEEARHVCFAENYLREQLPRASALRRAQIAWFAPLVFADCAQMMLIPSARIVAEFGISKHALNQAFGSGSDFPRFLGRITRSVRDLCRAHGMLSSQHAWWWRTMGIDARPL
jgi:hypothetical protein